MESARTSASSVKVTTRQACASGLLTASAVCVMVSICDNGKFMIIDESEYIDDDDDIVFYYYYNYFIRSRMNMRDLHVYVFHMVEVAAIHHCKEFFRNSN